MDITVKATGKGQYSLTIGELSMACAVGRSGIKPNKREGDGATPVARMPLRRVFYREDRLPKPDTRLKTRPILPNDGWCDAPNDKNYNRLVRLPYPASAEDMWRQDAIYDIVIELGYNDDPVVPGLGSAIFLHLARGKYEGTAGCVAVSLEDMRALLALVEPTSHLTTFA